MIRKFALCILIVALVLYGLLIGAVTGFSLSSCWMIWPAAALLLIGIWFWKELQKRDPDRFHFPGWVRTAFLTTIVLFSVVFIGIESAVVIHMNSDVSELQPRYLVILGGKVNGTEPSAILKERLDTAVSYWREHPRVYMVVTGGKGTNEHYTEADVMAYYLINNGVPDDRIIRESNATNTSENLQNTADLLYSLNAPIAIVSSNFHLFRARKIAEKTGFVNISTLSAPCEWYLLPHYMVREAIGVVKDFLLGNI